MSRYFKCPGVVLSSEEHFCSEVSISKLVATKHLWPLRVWWRWHPWFLLDTWALNTGEEASPWCWRTASRELGLCCQMGTPTTRGVLHPGHGVLPWRWRASTAKSTKHLWGVPSTWGSGGRDTGRGWERSSAEEGAGGEIQQPAGGQGSVHKWFQSNGIT